MKLLGILIRKEFLEGFRSRKLWVLGLVFLMVGFLNPITAKIIPEIMPELLPDNLVIVIPPAVPLDSWAQFYKNMTSMLMIIYFIVFCGILTNEFTKQTWIPLLSKGLPRRMMILSKWSYLVIVWTIFYVICFITTYGYTLWMIPGELPNLVLAASLLWFYGITLISLLMVFSVIFFNPYGVLVGLGGVSLLFSLLSIAVRYQAYNPLRIGSDNLQLLAGTLTLSDFTISLVINSVLIIASLVASIQIINRKEI